MSLQLAPSVPYSARLGPSISSSVNLISGNSIGAISGPRSVAASLQGGGGYYSSIGGGAAPFGPILNMQSLENGALLKSCVRHIERTNRRKRYEKEMTKTGSRKGPLDTGGLGEMPFRFDGNSLSQDGSTRTGKLYCRSGYHLQIHSDGKVNGTRQENNRFGVLEFLSVAFGLVSIKGKESNRYLCMNRRGRLYGSTRHTGECIFMEKMLENYYNTYTSCRYGRGRHSKKKWYVALNKRGRPKRGNQSRKKHKFTQFLVLHLDADDYKWTQRRFIFSNRDPSFGLSSFAHDWRRNQRVPLAQRLQPHVTIVTTSTSSNETIPNRNSGQLIQQHRLRQSRSTRNRSTKIVDSRQRNEVS